MKTLLAFSGASATGKTTLARQLSTDPSVSLVVSTTTRAMRPDETNCDYHFVSQMKFAALARSGSLLEWTAFCGHLYGITKAAVDAAFEHGSVAVVVCTPHALPKLARWAAAHDACFRCVYLEGERSTLVDRLNSRYTRTGIPQTLRIPATGVQTHWSRMHEYDLFLRDTTLDQTLAEVRALIAA